MWWMLTSAVYVSPALAQEAPLARYLKEVDSELVAEFNRRRYRDLRTEMLPPGERTFLATDLIGTSITAGSIDWATALLQDAGAGGWASLLAGPTLRTGNGRTRVTSSTAAERQGDPDRQVDRVRSGHRSRGLVMGSAWNMRRVDQEGFPLDAAIWATTPVPLFDTLRLQTGLIHHGIDATIRRSLWSGSAVFLGTHTGNKQITTLKGYDLGFAARLPWAASHLRTRYEWDRPKMDDELGMFQPAERTVILDLVIRAR